MYRVIGFGVACLGFRVQGFLIYRAFLDLRCSAVGLWYKADVHYHQLYLLDFFFAVATSVRVF